MSTYIIYLDKGLTLNACSYNVCVQSALAEQYIQLYQVAKFPRPLYASISSTFKVRPQNLCWNKKQNVCI